MLCEQRLVAGDHRLAQFNGPAKQPQRYVYSADQLNDYVDIGIFDYRHWVIGEHLWTQTEPAVFVERANRYPGNPKFNSSTSQDRGSPLVQQGRERATNIAAPEHTYRYLLHGRRA